MTTTTGAPAPAGPAAGGACRYPGCPNLARVKDHAAPGPRPGYCEQEVPEDHGDGTMTPVRHTAMTAFRRREQLAGQPGQDRPVTAAIGRAAAIRDDALAAMTRLSGQLTAALDQLAAIGGQLTAAADPLAAEAQIEAVRAGAAARIEQASAEAAAQASARHAAEADAAEARAAACEAVGALEEQAAARQHDLAALHASREETARAQRERDAALAAAEAARRDAATAREHDARQHAAALAASAARLDAVSDTIAALREQTDRAEAALDRERAGHHRTVTLLHDLITRPDAPPAGPHPREPAPAAGRRRPRAAEPPASTDTERTRP